MPPRRTASRSPLLKIKYAKERLCFNPLDYWKNGNVALEDFYKKILRTKSSAWLYENEYRWLVHLDLCKKEETGTFISINPEAIIGVDCGWECSEERIAFIKDLVGKNLGDRVKVNKTQADDYEFKFKYVST